MHIHIEYPFTEHLLSKAQKATLTLSQLQQLAHTTSRILNPSPRY